MKKGIPPEEIADFLEMDISEIQNIYNIAKKYAPDFDEDSIYKELMSDFEVQEETSL